MIKRRTSAAARKAGAPVQSSRRTPWGGRAMKTDHFLVIVTLASLLVYFWMGIRVARARAKFGVPVPAITGHPEFERTYRVQVNTLEWLPIFLPSMWLF